jgi:MFS family permease
MLAVLARRPAFARLWIAGVISLVGDWLTLVAVSVLAAGLGEAPLALAGVLAAHALPGAIASPLAGVLADRLDRRQLLVLAAASQAALTFAMAVAAARQAVGVVQIALLARSAIAALVPPGEVAALRHVVSEDELLPANAILGSTWSVAYVTGMTLGGALVMLGPAIAIVVDACSFVVCAALMATLPAMPSPPRTTTERGGFLRDLADALRFARARPGVLRALFSKAPVAIGGGAAWLALNFVAADARPFGSAALSLGALQAARGAGTGIGPAIAGALARRGVRWSSLDAAAFVVAFAGMVAFVWGRSWPFLLAPRSPGARAAAPTGCSRRPPSSAALAIVSSAGWRRSTS